MQEISYLEKRFDKKKITFTNQLDTRMDHKENILINKIENKMNSIMKEFQSHMIQHTTDLINNLSNKKRAENQNDLQLSQVYDETTNSVAQSNT